MTKLYQISRRGLIQKSDSGKQQSTDGQMDADDSGPLNPQGPEDLGFEVGRVGLVEARSLFRSDSVRVRRLSISVLTAANSAVVEVRSG